MGRGCPYCSGNKPSKDYNLAVINPELVKEWVSEKNEHSPFDYTPHSKAKVWWRCENGHQWEAVIGSRARGIGCPYCAGNLPTPENNLRTVYPEIASKWHPIKNKVLTPEKVTPASNRIVWWQCEKGHEWKVSVKSMKNGYQCPFCSGRKACKDNNLKVTHPGIAKEWHPSKNGGLNPSHFTSTMSDKVWWMCSQGHEWEAQINNRTVGGTGCPHCYDENRGDIYRAYAVKKVGSLAYNFPNIAKEWHPSKNYDLRSSDVTSKSSEKVWWLCPEGHEYEAIISHRTDGSGCPYCSHKLASQEYNLAEEYPEIAKEWHPTKNIDLKPSDFTPHSGKRVWWLCPEGHSYQASIQGRTRGSGCSFCAGKKVDETNSLASLYPEIAKEWHPSKNGDLIPSEVTSKSSRKVWWICPHGHEYGSRIADRTKGVGCPYCSPKTSRIEIRILTELITIFEEVIHREIFDGYECDIFIPKYNLGIEIDGYWHKIRTDRDKEKLEYFNSREIELIRIRDRRLELSEQDVPYSENEKHIEVVKRLLENMIKKVSFSPQIRLKIERYINENKIQNQKLYQEKTRYLNTVSPENSLEALFPDIAKEWDYDNNYPLVPSSFAPFSKRKVHWICEKGHSWNAPIYTRTSGHGCPKCSGNVASEENNLAVMFPELAKQWHPTKNGDLKPTNVTYGSNKRVWWLDDEGKEWEARIKHRTSNYSNANQI